MGINRKYIMKHPYKVFLFTLITFSIEMTLLKYFNQYNYFSWLVGYTHALIYNMFLERQDK